MTPNLSPRLRRHAERGSHIGSSIRRGCAVPRAGTGPSVPGISAGRPGSARLRLESPAPYRLQQGSEVAALTGRPESGAGVSGSTARIAAGGHAGRANLRRPGLQRGYWNLPPDRSQSQSQHERSPATGRIRNGSCWPEEELRCQRSAGLGAQRIPPPVLASARHLCGRVTILVRRGIAVPRTHVPATVRSFEQ